MTLSPVRRDGCYFRDAHGRQIMLRGVNLGGDCKMPWPDGGCNVPTDFSDHREVSFIGRPFPIEEAAEHLGRLKHWGFNVVRLLTTWEAVEHAGPGLYDEDYLDYFTEVCRLCGEHGLYVFVDFHQDVWSRMSGGDGAPGWTFDAVGLDFTKFDAAGAAHVMQYRYDYSNPSGRQASYPQMSWGSNYRMAANGIMWTLFWGGRTFTPQLMVEGRNIQDFLQGAYLGCVEQIASRIKSMPNVLGFDTLNEPGIGWVGEHINYHHMGPSDENPLRGRPGPVLSPLDQLATARGLSVKAPVLTRNPDTGSTVPSGEVLLNPNGVSIWKEGVACPFEAAGAYRVENGQAIALDGEFFRSRNGQRLDICEFGFGPLFHAVAEVTRKYEPTWPIFAEIDPFGIAAGRTYPKHMPENSVNAGHWYDASTLYLKSFDPTNHFDFMTGENETSPAQIRERYIRQIRVRHENGANFPGGAPTLIGEFGIPFDLDDGEAYEAWAKGERDVWSPHQQALSLMYDAMDALQIHSTLWNYTASNRNALVIGDGWNQEDLSIFSRDQQEDPTNPDSGGRAIEGFCRPYGQALQGDLTDVYFDQVHLRFELSYDANPAIAAPSEIYVPRIQFPDGFSVAIEGEGVRHEIDLPGQRVLIWSKVAGPVRIWIEAS